MQSTMSQSSNDCIFMLNRKCLIFSMKLSQIFHFTHQAREHSVFKVIAVSEKYVYVVIHKRYTFFQLFKQFLIKDFICGFIVPHNIKKFDKLLPLCILKTNCKLFLGDIPRVKTLKIFKHNPSLWCKIVFRFCVHYTPFASDFFSIHIVSRRWIL